MLQNLDDLPDEVLEFGVADRLAFARFYSHWTFRRDARGILSWISIDNRCYTHSMAARTPGSALRLRTWYR